MFGIGFFELLVIAVFALVFVGPKKLPEVMRQAGKFFVHIRRTANDVRSTFDQVVKDAEDEIRREEAEHVKALLASAPKPAAPVTPGYDKHVPPHNADGTPGSHAPTPAPTPSETTAAQTGTTPDGAKPYTPGAPGSSGAPLTHDATWHPVAQPDEPPSASDAAATDRKDT
jgi:sec-independent protein translocase protein TatB